MSAKKKQIEERQNEIDKLTNKVDQAVADMYEWIRQKGNVYWEIEKLYSQMIFENRTLGIHVKESLIELAKKKGDLS